MLILKEKGQAALEYILLLMLSLFIAGGLVYQFNDAFKIYVNSYFGEYLTCLIEAGELPTLGYDGPGGDLCADEFQPFSLANGRPPVGTDGVVVTLAPRMGGDGIKVDPVKSPPPPDKIGGRDAGTDFQTRGADGGSLQSDRSVPFVEGAGANAGIGGGRWGGGVLSDKAKERPTTVGLNKDEQEASESSIESTGGGVIARHRRAKKADDRPAIIPLNTREQEDEDKVEKKARIPAQESDVIQGNVIQTSDGKRKRKAIDTDIEDGLDFSDWIRYIIIAAIIIALILFLGGQALQISKSQEKG